jgi:predicted O-methyltransferase YrrM
MNIIISLWRSRFNIPRRTFWFIIQHFILGFSLFKISVQQQENDMNLIGLNRSHGLEKLNSVLKELFNKQYDERDGMFSEHLVLLASISVSVSDVDIRNILEIGTYDGRTARILSKLFPKAHILTIDLPSTNEKFENSYNRRSELNTFLTKRNKNLIEASNVEFKEMNSLELSKCEENFDLIWIDGAHGYPIIAMDLINSFRIANNNGYVLIDDIFKTGSESDNMYKSIGGYEALKSLLDAKLISSFMLFPKRLGGIFNYPGGKKYVGLFRKNL